MGLNQEISILRRNVDNLPDEISKATETLRNEGERVVNEERHASAKAQERAQVRNNPHLPSVSVTLYVYFLTYLVNKIPLLY